MVSIKNKRTTQFAQANCDWCGHVCATRTRDRSLTVLQLIVARVCVQAPLFSLALDGEVVGELAFVTFLTLALLEESAKYRLRVSP